MAQVSFYVIKNQMPIHQLACRLCHRVAIVAGVPLFLRCHDTTQLQQLDDLLWTYEPHKFIPHAIMQGDHMPVQPLMVKQHIENCWLPVTLGLTPPVDFQGCCLNLATEPLEVVYFQRILEIIGPEPAELAQGRLKFLHYKNLGLSHETFNV